MTRWGSRGDGLQTAEPRLQPRACPRERSRVPSHHHRQDHRGVHGDHGGRGVAHPRRTPHLRVDAGPAGPEPVGPQGLLQPAADGLKNILKEETLPAQADRLLFLLAPAISFIPALLTFAVIPFGAPLHSKWGDIPLVVA